MNYIEDFCKEAYANLILKLKKQTMNPLKFLCCLLAITLLTACGDNSSDKSVSIEVEDTNTTVSQTKRKVYGTSTPDALGRALFEAIRKDNVNEFYSYIVEGTKEEATANLKKIREQLQMAGLSDWKLPNVTRVTYSKNHAHNEAKTRDLYDSFVIEFSYGSKYEGFICGRYKFDGMIELVNGKYSSLNGLEGVNLYNKDL